MLLLALLELVVLLVVTMAFLSILRAQNRSHARREDILLDKALHAAGRPWTPAPAEERRRDLAEELDDLLAVRAFTQTPEQEP